jgi:hypothetical protein
MFVSYFILAGSPVRGGSSSWSQAGGIFIFQICGVKGWLWKQKKKSLCKPQ